jgi:heptosyltransferase II
MRILIIKTAAMGDVVRTAYCLPSLREAHPGAEITWLTNSNAVDFLRFNPYVHVLITNSADLTGSYDWIISLEEEQIVPQVMLRRQIAEGRKLTGCWMEGSAWRYSEEGAEWFDMSRVSVFGLDEANRLKKKNTRGHAEMLGEMLGVKIARPSFWGHPALSSAKQKIAATGRLKIALNLSAGNRWPSKKMPLEEGRLLLRRLLNEMNCEIHVMGGAADLDYNSQLCADINSARVSLAPPQNLLGFAAAIARMDLLVSADTLALHLALSQQTPTVAFFTTTSAAEIDGWGIAEKVTSLSSDYCSYRPNADSSTITGSRIFQAVEKLANRVYGLAPHR